MNRNHANRFFAFLLLTVLILLPVGELFSAGQTIFPLLKQQSTPYNLALGGAAVTRGTATAFTTNPALIISANRYAYSSFARVYGDMWSGSLIYVHPFLEKFTGGVVLDHLNYGDFDETDVSWGKSGRIFNAGDYLFTGTLGWQWNEQTQLGGSLKYAYGFVGEDDASAFAVDLGIVHSLDWQDLRLGLVARNLGSQTDRYGSETFDLPTEIVVGGSRKLNHLPLTINVATQFVYSGEGEYELDFLPSEPSMSFSVGGEFEIKPAGAKNPVNLRIGYQSKADQLRVGFENDMIGGFSAGIGFIVSAFTIDYAFAPMGGLGDIHRFGIMYKLY